MEFFNSKRFIAFLFILLLGVFLFGCANKDLKTTQDVDKQPTVADTIGNTPKIIRALTCIFAPQECVIKK